MSRWLSAALAALLVAGTAGECNINPADKTPAKPPAPRIEIRMEVTAAAEANQVWANVTVNAVDLSGLPTVDVETGELYPTTRLRRVPYGHWLTQPAESSARYSIEATVGGVPGDIFGCAIYVSGVLIKHVGTPHVVTIPPGGQSALVYCEHTVVPGGGF